MAVIDVILRGQPADHHVMSPELSDEEFERAMAALGDTVGTTGRVRLNWLVAKGTDIIAATPLPTEQEAA